MGDIERFNSDLPVRMDSSENTTQDMSGMPQFDLPTYLERQGVIDGILARQYPSSESQVTDLNDHIARWDDERGISYTYIAGRTLPGLAIHVPATAMAFAANYAPKANFEGANLDYAVFSGSVMPDAKFRRTSLDHAVMPMLQISGDARGVSAVKSIWNLANVQGLDMGGMDVGASYLLGTQGLSEEKLLSLADSQEAMSTLADAESDEDMLAMLSDGLSRFTGSNEIKAIIRRLRHPQVFSGLNSSGIMLRKQLRDRRQGMLLHNVMLNSSEISKYDFEGNVWADVIADRATAVSTRFAGAIILNSSFDDVESRGSKAPGMVSMNSSFRGMALPNNSAGSIYFDCDLTGAVVDEVQEGGMVIVGGKPPVIEKERPDIRVLSHDQLPELVLQNLKKYQQIKVSPKPIARPVPQIET